ncbi:MarR family winged helix-turn-helix transcriptional regulator [Armatimonas rosea]|uniref:DNA-binding MarR family transcriptional regulator n=1 Tax=Armatimonas rosea TaxID=685828 RepID=A0A7W9SQY1_ARMRO|nr:MarR family transcriptional regulator [Armatimonas rosea]MBB6051172.1 DNA-binding MarR family transcriptional regulator [Armatimonas rosea]
MLRVRSISQGHELALALRSAYLEMHRCVDTQFRQTGVTADQFVVLSALAEAGCLTQRRLADQITCDQNTLRAMLLLLEKKGLVLRQPHPTDGRARLVSLTSEGEVLQKALSEQLNPLRQSLGESLRPEETELLLELLRRVAATISAPAST